ncbi:MAG: reverse transcriptase-like protein [Candidatus Saccharibacteria bacterium]|nr:reverse transcriptase-like protein [Candidatus Saccharibacteria bacterium]
MKQRIRVVGIVRNENGVLILKRSRSRSEAPVFWELPTGKIKFGEQPEEAMARALAEFTGLTATSVKLKDVITFLGLEGASRLSNLYIVYEVGISKDQKINPLGRYTAYKFIKDPSETTVHLSEASASVFEIEENKLTPNNTTPRSTANSATVYVDGASRGNPGPSGIGYCIYDSAGQVIAQGGEFIGFATSRVAEYYAMRKGVELAIEKGLKSVRFVSDSLMVVNQLNGIFSVKNKDIMPIYRDIKELLKNFENVSFTHVQRSSNVVADTEANEAIDQILNPVI